MLRSSKVGVIFLVIVTVGFLTICVLEEGKDEKAWLRRWDLNFIPKDLWRPENVSKVTDDRILEQYTWARQLENSEFLKHAKTKNILVFEEFSLFYGTEGKVKCPFPTPVLSEKCVITQDKLLYGFEEDINRYDAVVGLRYWVHRFYEPKVAPSTLQFMYIVESPYTIRSADLSKNNAILGSYWRGSDISIPYRKWIPNSQSYNLTDLDFEINMRQLGEKDMRNFATGRKRMAAIIVSNCEARNARLAYVQQLQKYIQVDVFGQCGMPCPQDDNGKDNCIQHVKQNYKFYLAFENANCRDYITEKLFHNAIVSETVPIVLGAHPDDYSFAMPPHSYILAENFTSPQELTEHLKQLDMNDDAYNDYFAWRRNGVILATWSHFFCRACAMLFYADFYSPPVWKPNSHWNTVHECLPESKWYWTRPG